MTNTPFNNDEEGNLRMENELLRLKLIAELGGAPNTIEGFDPAIENEFLKNILAFERNHANSKRIKLYEKLGRPDFKRADELNEGSIATALQEITDLLLQKNMTVDFSGEYDDRTKYHFITEELFDYEVDDLVIKGMMTHFDYEEFHPNHKLDIERRAINFLEEWFSQSLNERSWELASGFVLPNGTVLDKSKVVAQFKNIFNAYTAFTDEEYFIEDIGFKLQEDFGLGHAEGTVKYNAVLENGDVITFEGLFKLYLSFEEDWWSIFHIVFPGFEY